MREYLLSFAGVVILSGVITMLGADGGLKNYIKLLCSLSVLCVLVSPLIELAAEGDFNLEGLWDGIKDEDINYEEIYKESWEKYEIETAERILKESISSAFSVNLSDFEIDIKTVSKNGKAEPESVTVVLRDRGVLADPRRISDYINETMECPAVIVYE